MTVSWMLWELVKNQPKLAAGLDVAIQRHQSGFFISSVLSAAEIILELNDLMISRTESFLD